MSLVRMIVALSWPGTGSPGENVWDVRTTDTPDPSGSVALSAASAAIEQFYDTLTSVPSPFCGQYTAQFGGEWVDLNTRETYVTPTWTQTNGGSANSAPAVAQAVLTMKTSQATRSGRGRKFLGPIAPNAVASDGSLAATAQGHIQDAGNALVAASTGANGWAISIVSFWLNKQRRPNPVGLDVTSVLCRPYIGALRSRRD